MRYDAERPRTHHFISDAPVPEHWALVRKSMLNDPGSSLSNDEINTSATSILIWSPASEVTTACLSGVLNTINPTGNPPAGIPIHATAEAVVPTDVPPGTWVFLPHRRDGWAELETTSARSWIELTKENGRRERQDRFTLIEYGVNLWFWAEPPHNQGDPVCHAGELISWESAWTVAGPESVGARQSVATSSTFSGATSNSATARPAIYFGLPSVLSLRRR